MDQFSKNLPSARLIKSAIPTQYLPRRTKTMGLSVPVSTVTNTNASLRIAPASNNPSSKGTNFNLPLVVGQPSNVPTLAQNRSFAPSAASVLNRGAAQSESYPKCIVKCCKNYFDKSRLHLIGVDFEDVPKEPERLAKWEQQIKKIPSEQPAPTFALKTYSSVRGRARGCGRGRGRGRGGSARNDTSPVESFGSRSSDTPRTSPERRSSRTSARFRQWCEIAEFESDGYRIWLFLCQRHFKISDYCEKSGKKVRRPRSDPVYRTGTLHPTYRNYCPPFQTEENARSFPKFSKPDKTNDERVTTVRKNQITVSSSKRAGTRSPSIFDDSDEGMYRIAK
ncbi:unnamed protein product [Nesidiocoris tenuis]|uniref:THAP-type domain-containing protein n=1 Tax=Nesidiocoris tenuis TaxID=355587 RepID=A0A6H5GVG4_9HEMI|nr:unnamed protein product [Nesidiocoris tenuis]